MALADLRQNGCLAAVNVMAKPEATIQAVTTKRNEVFDGVCRDSSDVKKFRLAGLVALQAAALQRSKDKIVVEPCETQR